MHHFLIAVSAQCKALVQVYPMSSICCIQFAGDANIADAYDVDIVSYVGDGESGNAAVVAAGWRG